MKKRFISLGLVCAVGLGAWFAMAFRPAQSRLGALRTDVETTRERVTSLEAQLQHLLGLKRNESELRDNVAKMTAALPADPAVPDFIVQVQEAANLAGIDFLSVAPSLPAVPAQAVPAQASGTPTTNDQAPSTPLRSISVQVTADGQFFEIEAFVQRLERLARAVKIDDFALKARSDGPDGGRLSATMRLEIFMLTPQAAAGPSGAQTSTPGAGSGA